MFRLGALLGLVGLVVFLSGCANIAERYEKRAAKQQTSSASCDGTYKVVKNDSLSLVAQKCKVDMYQLARANDLHPPYVLYPNQDLILPQKDAPVKNNLNWAWPVKNYDSYKFIQGSYGIKSLEVYGSLGESIYAIADGEVIFASITNSEFGKMIMVRHSKDYMSIYAHNSNLLVRKGDKVRKGQIVAHLGNSGEVNQPKLLLEIRLNGKKLSVDKFIQPK